MSFTTTISRSIEVFNLFFFELRALIVAEKKDGGRIASRDP